VNTNGTGFAVLHDFNGTDGYLPNGDLVLSGSLLYGTTYQGGTAGAGVIFKVHTNGTGYTVLKTYLPGNESPWPDGWGPAAGLLLSNNTLYGTAREGGSMNAGTIFKIDTDGSNYTVLWNFEPESSGFYPEQTLVLSGSALFGTTLYGGSFGNGTVFKLDLAPHLGPVSVIGGLPQIAVTAIPGQALQIQVATNLLTSNLTRWAILTNIVATNGHAQFSDPSGMNFQRRFYRALAQ
jgi:uncharacterized repeat protein (TIGR03803 family)